MLVDFAVQSYNFFLIWPNILTKKFKKKFPPVTTFPFCSVFKTFDNFLTAFDFLFNHFSFTFSLHSTKKPLHF